jgi:hypothetical protein
LELFVLGVAGKLVKYVVHSSKRNNWNMLPKQHTTSFLFQGILGVKSFAPHKVETFDIMTGS